MVVTELSTDSEQVSPKSNNPRKIGFTSLAIIVAFVLVYLFYSQQSPDDTQPVQPEVTAKSIAVLPFKDDSEGGDNQYFCDGMMDEILNHLQKIAELGVKSRSAVEPYRNSDLSFATKAQELDVAFILEGSVRKYGDRFRVTTQLIEVESGNHLWSETYDGILSDTIFVIQSNIAKKIAASLNTVITPDEEKSIDRIPTTDIAAYDLYVRARYEQQLYWKTSDKKHLKTSHNLLDKALEIDLDYLEAIVAKGETFRSENNYDSALVYADKVLKIDSKLRSAYALKGACYVFTGRPDRSAENYLIALDLPPKDNQWLSYHTALGQAYVMQDEVIRALPYLQKGLENEEKGGGEYFWVAAAFAAIGEYQKAKTYNKKAIELACFGVSQMSSILLSQGKFLEAFQIADSTCHGGGCQQECSLSLFRASLLLGEFEQAEQYFHQWKETGEDFPGLERLMNIELGYVYYQLGKTEEAEKIFAKQIEELESNLDRQVLRYYALPRIYAFTGKIDKALNHLKYSQLVFFGGWHDFILIDPLFESLWDNSEFKAIVKNAQEEKAALREQVRQMQERGELDL